MTLSIREKFMRNMDETLKKMEELDNLYDELGGLKGINKLKDAKREVDAAEYNASKWEKSYRDLYEDSESETIKFWTVMEQLSYAIKCLRPFDPEKAEELEQKRMKFFEEDAL